MLSIVLGALELLPCLSSLLIWASMGSSIAADSRFLGVFCLMSVNWLLAALLVVAGIHLLRQKQAAIVHLHYAVLRLIWLAVAAALLGSILAHVSALADRASRGAAAPGDPFPSIGSFYLSVLLGCAAAAAYPVFLLVWFSRRVIRQELRQWRHLADAEAPTPPEGRSDG